MEQQRFDRIYEVHFLRQINHRTIQLVFVQKRLHNIHDRRHPAKKTNIEFDNTPTSKVIDVIPLTVQFQIR